MANMETNLQNLITAKTDIENAIITKSGTVTGWGFSNLADDITNLSTITTTDEGKVVQNGALVSQTSTSVSQNGTINTTTNNSVTVNVPNTYTASDEGKVVSNGALVAQTSDTVTENGTVDTTLINSLMVNVSASGGGAAYYTRYKATSSSSTLTKLGFGIVGDKGVQKVRYL
jgi:hypothetical protein